MKIVLLLLGVCLAMVCAVTADDDLMRMLRDSFAEGPVNEIARRETKYVNGYQFTITPAGNGKYHCECKDPSGQQVYIAFCTVRDKGFAHTDCV